MTTEKLEKLNTAGYVYLSTVEKGTLMLVEDGFHFIFSQTTFGKPLYFTWDSIARVEAHVSWSGKIGQEFVLVFYAQPPIRFSTKETGKVLKFISKQIGDEKMIRQTTLATSLTRPFRRQNKN